MLQNHLNKLSKAQLGLVYFKKILNIVSKLLIKVYEPVSTNKYLSFYILI